MTSWFEREACKFPGPTEFRLQANLSSRPERSVVERSAASFSPKRNLPIVPPGSVRACGLVTLNVLGNFDDALRSCDRTLPTVRLEVPVHELSFRAWRGRGLQPCFKFHGGVVEKISVGVAGKEIEIVLKLRANCGPVAL